MAESSSPGSEALHALHSLIVTDVRDWSVDANDARLYGIVVGWPRAALDEIAKKHAWTPLQIKRLKDARKDYKRLTTSVGIDR